MRGVSRKGRHDALEGPNRVRSVSGLVHSCARWAMTKQ